MGTEARGLNGKKAPAPPSLPLIRVRSRATRVNDLDDGAAASLRTPITVPFLWEDAPGKPKLPQTGTVPADGGTTATSTDDKGCAKARLMPLKLPPRLQVPSTAADHSLSPRTVLQGPYGCTGGTRRPPRTAALRRVASFRRTPSAAAGGGLFSRRKADKKSGRDHDAAAPDTSYSSPSPSSASSSSSSSFFGDDCRGHGGRRRPDDGRAGPEEDDSAKGLVRITRFRRNKSLPSMTMSHLWASIRKSVKQIAPWS